MRIDKWNDEAIFFSDGSIVTYDHDQDCCEYNYADFTVLDVFYDGEEFIDYRLCPVKYGVNLVLMNGNRKYSWNCRDKTIYIPFYSDQNGCYSDDVCLIVKWKKELIIGGFESCVVSDFLPKEEDVLSEFDKGEFGFLNVVLCKTCNEIMLCRSISDLTETIENHKRKEHARVFFDKTANLYVHRCLAMTSRLVKAKNGRCFYVIEPENLTDIP